MLTKSFLFLPGISKRKEGLLWEQGILSWNDFLRKESITGISKKRLLLYKQLLRVAKEAALAKDEVFFARCLPLAEQYRTYSLFKEDAICLDVEIDKYRQITVVTVTDGVDTKVLVKGVNLYKEELKRALAKTKLIITFNGASFDLPLLQKEFGISWKGLHIDLKTVARRKGYIGGLKELEKSFGITREYEKNYVLKSGDPALLYRMWRGSGNEEYLRLLLAYNEEDAYNLFVLAKKLLD